MFENKRMRSFEEFLDYLVSHGLLESARKEFVHRVEDLWGPMSPDKLAGMVAKFLELELVEELPGWPNLALDEQLFRRCRLYPLAVGEGKIKLAMVDPWDEEAIYSVCLLVGGEIERGAVISESLLSTVLPPMETEENPWPVSEFQAAETDPIIIDLDRWLEHPARRQVYLMLIHAVHEKAENIVVRPLAAGLEIEFVDYYGSSELVCILPQGLAAEASECIEELGEDCRGRRTQRVRVKLRFDNGKMFNLRLSRWPDRIELRFLSSGLAFPALEQIGLTAEQLQLWSKMLEGNGMLLMTGPPASGLSRTWLASLTYMHRKSRTVATLEDPVERWLPGGDLQVDVRRCGQNFVQGLESILQDGPPQAIFLADLPDLECLRLCLEAADKHLLVATLEADCSKQALWQLSRSQIPDHLFSRLRGLCSQRLYPRLCEYCRRPVAPPPELESELKQVYEAPGCDFCFSFGHPVSSNIGVFEIVAPMPNRWWKCQDLASLEQHLASFPGLRSEWVKKVAMGDLAAENPPKR